MPSECACRIPLTVAEPDEVAFSAAEYIPVRVTDAPAYDGPYEVSAARWAQVLPTAGRVMTADLTVRPIPSNWGLITWDGSTLTVS